MLVIRHVEGRVTGGIPAERNREINNVALVALNILQVLDDHRLDPLVHEEPFKSRIVAPRVVKEVLDQRLLPDVEGITPIVGLCWSGHPSQPSSLTRMSAAMARASWRLVRLLPRS